MRIFIGFVALVFFSGLSQAQNYCDSWSANEYDTSLTGLYVEFGLNEGEGTPIHHWYVDNDWFQNSDLYTYAYNDELVYETFWLLNQVPITGGKNFTTYASGYVPTANFTCTGFSSAMWGPAYPDYISNDGNFRYRNPHLETYVHYSAPNVNGSISKICAKINIQDFTYNLKPETSYFRTIIFIKNTGTKAERVQLFSSSYTEAYCTDASPIDNKGRYYTGDMYGANDKGSDGDRSYYPYWPSTIHVKGQKGLDQSAMVDFDLDDYYLHTYHTAILAAGEQVAFMQIQSNGVNISAALKTAADIDAEPAYIFHDLTADQLAMIRNWGGCQAVIGPTATVTITPPSQCSNGLTSDFTVQASSTRKDLTADFAHQVLALNGAVVVAPQSSATLSVPNGIGQATHQLWYKGCLVKETTFNACDLAAPVAAPTTQSVPVATPTTTKKSAASSVAVASLLSLVAVALL